MRETGSASAGPSQHDGDSMPEQMIGPVGSAERPADLAARRGFLLPAIVLIALVLALMFGALSYMTRGQVHSAAYFIDASRALGLAEAGAGWAIAALASGSYTVSPEFVRRDFYDALFSEGGTDYEGDVEPCDELKQYINKLNGDLSLRVRLSQWQPLAAGAPGFKDDPVEKMGRIDVEAVAEVGNAHRKVRMSRGVKVYLGVHPVIGKFTCFIRKKPASDDLVNALERTTNGTGFSNGTPLVLNNRGSGNGFNVVTPAIDLGTLPDLNELSKTSGWVFLNSDTSAWTLNLAGSAQDTDYDDRSMLRFGAYSNDALQTTVNTPPQAGGTTVTQVNEKFQGLKRDYTISKGGSVVVASDFLSVRYLFPSLPKASIVRPSARTAICRRPSCSAPFSGDISGCGRWTARSTFPAWKRRSRKSVFPAFPARRATSRPSSTRRPRRETTPTISFYMHNYGIWSPILRASPPAGTSGGVPRRCWCRNPSSRV